MVHWCGRRFGPEPLPARSAFALSLLIRVNLRCHFPAPAAYPQGLAQERQAEKRGRQAVVEHFVALAVLSAHGVSQRERRMRETQERSANENPLGATLCRTDCFIGP
jgi:hypothetical protein